MWCFTVCRSPHCAYLFLSASLIYALYCCSYSTAGIVIQGETENELPEHVLACAALKYIDIAVHSPLESFAF